MRNPLSVTHVVLLFLMACVPRAAQQAPPQVMVVPVPAPVTPMDPVAGTLAGAGVVLGMPYERQAEEIARWSESLDRTGQPTDRLRIAMLMTMGDEAVRDDDRVRSLLRGQVWDANHGGYEMLARMLLEVVETRAEAEREAIDLTGAVQREREKRALVEAQLEALRDLETEIDAREEVVR